MQVCRGLGVRGEMCGFVLTRVRGLPNFLSQPQGSLGKGDMALATGPPGMALPPPPSVQVVIGFWLFFKQIPSIRAFHLKTFVT